MSAPSQPGRPIETLGLEWRGERLTVTYEPNWLGVTGHLEVRADRDGAGLPITRTGYRSHFLNPAHVDAAGGPLAYVRLWLDQAAADPAWLEEESAARQMALF